VSFPLRRSSVFWGGLLVGAFLVFGWVDSLRHSSGVILGKPVIGGTYDIMASQQSLL
jgi:hypothetical protein